MMNKVNKTQILNVSSLKVIALNVNSLISNYKRSELLELLEKTNPDVVLLSETWLKSNHKVFYQHYNLIQNHRCESRKGGGTAILINKNMDFEIVNVNLKQLTIEHTSIAIKCNNIKLIVSAIYVTRNSNKFFTKEIDDLFTKLRFKRHK